MTNSNQPRIFFLGILVSIALFTILTIPHLSLFMFGYGFKYPTTLIYVIAIFSGFSSSKIAQSKLFNK